MDAKLRDQAEELARELAAKSSTVADVNDLLRAVLKTTLERMLNTEMDVHLGRRSNCRVAEAAADDDGPADRSRAAAPKNRRNGHSRKTVSGDLGDIPLETPRDRQGSFEPQLIGKYQRRLAGFDEKILAMYAKGMTTRDIQDLVQQLYGVEISASLVSEITADLDIEVSAWRTRRLQAVWPIVYLDGIRIHVRNDNGAVVDSTMYVAIGVNLQGRKELLGLWLAESEGAKFWLSCLNDLKSRGLEDIFIVCVDGLSGFADAIRVVYPKARVQRCIVHLVRAALKYVSTKDTAEVLADLKTIYQAATRFEAERQLDAFEGKWGDKYPMIGKHWRLHWDDIVTMFEFPAPIRKVIYTTNVIESINSVTRKYTRNRKQYPNTDSAIKLFYMAIREASKKWTIAVANWKEALNHFAIMFEDRMPKLN
jgi:transposase-like protein